MVQGEQSSTNGPDTPQEPPTSAPPGEPDGEANRREVQALLGQIEGLMRTMIDHPDAWCPDELVESIREAYRGLGPAFGALHAGLNSGAYDRTLIDNGLGGPALESKRRGMWSRAKAFIAALSTGAPGKVLDSVRSLTRWMLVPLETLVSTIPGGIAVKEVVLTIQAAAEQVKDVGKTG